ncbi:sensor histidine kinase [Radicibacter daui]|uniref:sensor histidine kinase n=1 Tax=Radicibacter daui TaxID=3064829 RepID=UPI004046E95F
MGSSTPASPSLPALLLQLSMARGRDEIMAVVRSGVRALVGSDGVTFVLREGGFCHYADEDAISPLWKGQRFPLQTCISGHAMLEQRPILIPDIYLDPRVPHDAYRPTFVKSMMMVPVRTEDPVGAIGVYWADKHLATAKEEELVATVANGAAVALTNVALYGELEAARDEALKANRAKSVFLANMSHELRTPLNAIIGFADMLQLPAMARTPEQLTSYLHHISTSGTHLLDLVTDLLALAEIEEGRFPIALTAQDCGEMVDDIVERMSGTASHAGIELRRQLPQRSPGPVRADRRATKQILLNLVSSAVQFTPRGGLVEVGARASGPRRTFMVRDTGAGLDEEKLQLVQDPFVRQGRLASLAGDGGGGLGLSIASALTRLQGGDFSIESRKGTGTTVTVSLPAWAELTAGRG